MEKFMIYLQNVSTKSQKRERIHVASNKDGKHSSLQIFKPSYNYHMYTAFIIIYYNPGFDNDFHQSPVLQSLITCYEAKIIFFFHL